MAPCVKLFFTILVILNFMCIVSPQDELEHGLATGCDAKGKLFPKIKDFD